MECFSFHREISTWKKGPPWRTVDTKSKLSFNRFSRIILIPCAVCTAGSLVVCKLPPRRCRLRTMDGLKSLTGLLMNTFVMPVLNFFDGSVSVGGLIGNHSVSHILSKSNSTQERVLVEITPEDVDIFLKTKAILHTLFNILALAAVCGCLYALYHFFFTPLDRVRKLGSIG